MRTSAVSIAENTWALVAGISNYDRLSFLPSPAKDAGRLASTLADQLGTAIPPNRVASLAEERTERTALVSALEKLIRDTQENDLAFFYFAGHGERNGDQFYLCTSETDPASLGETALSSSELDRILGGFRGRGLFVVLDCCRGAGFAEHAPAVFWNLGNSEFKILLSATRENQFSWELPDGSGTLFTRILTMVLEGEEVPGSKPGLIYLSELFEYIRKRMAEEFELSSRLPEQDPIYAGVVSRDPLLFVHSRLTLEQVAVQTVRYSRAFIVRLLRRIALGLVVALFIMFGGIFTYLDHSRFIQPTATGLTIYRGDPRLKFMGYPYLEWELSIPTEGSQAKSPLRRGVSVRFWRDVPIEQVFRAELRPEFLILVLRWEKKDDAAHKAIVGFLKGPSSVQTEYLGAMSGLLADLGTADDKGLFAQLAASPRSDVRLPALGALAHFAPTQAVALVRGRMNSDSRADHNAVLAKLSAPCDQSMSNYISDTLTSPDLSPLHSAAISAAITAKCTLPVSTLVAASRSAMTLQDISTAAYAIEAHQQKELESALLNSFPSSTNWAHAANGLLTIAAMPGANCDTRLRGYLTDHEEWVRWAAVVASLHHCDKAAVAASVPRDPRVMAELASVQLVPGSEVIEQLGHTHEIDIWSMLSQAIPISSATAAEPLLKQVIENHQTDPEIRKQAVIALHRLHIASDYAVSLYRDEWTSVQIEAYKWRAEDHPEEVAGALLDRFNDQSASDFIPGILRTLPLTDQQLKSIRTKISGSETEKSNAVAVLTMRGPLTDATDLLVDRDRKVRSQAADYAGARSDLPNLLAKLKSHNPAFPDASLAALDIQATFHQMLLKKLQALPCTQVSFFLDQVYEGETSEGIKRWLEADSDLLKGSCSPG